MPLPTQASRPGLGPGLLPQSLPPVGFRQGVHHLLQLRQLELAIALLLEQLAKLHHLLHLLLVQLRQLKTLFGPLFGLLLDASAENLGHLLFVQQVQILQYALNHVSSQTW